MYPVVSVNGYAIYSKSKIKDACWKLVTFFASHEMNSYWSENTGGMPANKLAQEEAWFKDSPYNEAFLRTIRNPPARSETLMHLPEAPEFEETLFTPELQKCLLGQQTAQETGDKITAALTEAQKKWLVAQKPRELEEED